jgi:hypothetical protein
MGAALCSPDLDLVAATPGFPVAFACRTAGPHLRADASEAADCWTVWRHAASLTGGAVRGNAIPLSERGEVKAFPIAIHDLSYVARRVASTR